LPSIASKSKNCAIRHTAQIGEGNTPPAVSRLRGFLVVLLSLPGDGLPNARRGSCVRFVAIVQRSIRGALFEILR
jgi:hypothetical protein